MLHFDSDYMEGAHPLILKRLSEINFEKNEGYGLDPYCESATEKIRKACNCPNAQVVYLVGGTQTNALVSDAIMHRGEGVLTPRTGHINTHEAGAIEGWGHKVIEIRSELSKMTAEDIADYVDKFFADGSYEHMVLPTMVYISNPTEYGTLYSLSELTAISKVCHERHLPLYMDGARLGYGLASPGYDVTLADIARLVDVFYIGGTKVGALFGEAVVFSNPKLNVTLRLVKHHGALLAKGWLLGVQFDTLFTDDLYMRISANAVNQALRLKQALLDKGYELFCDSMTNQQFVVLENSKVKEMLPRAGFKLWEKFDETRSVVRFATSWATTDEQIDELIAML